MDRKEARDAWKERRPDAGIYALRIGAETWVGAASRLRAAEQRAEFMLPKGMAHDPAMRSAYADAKSYRFEVLEAFDDDISAMKRERLLKERLIHWIEQTGGRRI